MKAVILVMFLVCVGLFSSSVMGQHYIGGCNKASRICDEWTMGPSGVWKSCENSCKEQEKNGGKCSEAPDCPPGQSYKCRCH